jgi:hypothetical protein
MVKRCERSYSGEHSFGSSMICVNCGFKGKSKISTVKPLPKSGKYKPNKFAF